MLGPPRNFEKSQVDMGQFGASMLGMPATAERIGAAYPLDDPVMSEQLEFYKAATGIHDTQKLKAHLFEIRAEGCKTFPFPCVLCFHFLQGMIARHSFFPNVINAIKDNSKTRKIFMDIGAGMGNDLRQVIHHGWNRNDVLGVDVDSEWSALGYKLFRDQKTPVPNFIGNILTPEVLNVSIPTKVAPISSIDLHTLKDLNSLKGRVNFISSNQLFHFFNETEQRRLAERCALLLSNEPGSAIFGMQVGGSQKGVQTSIKTFVHSPMTWEEMWVSVFGPNKVKVVSELVETSQEDHLVQLFPDCKGIKRLYWSVTRI
ncbi:hypothetical protein Pst134EA_028988 [Puccinia striiformis f. sp. tritici]|uniref:hypothetical protein n=1 Tax=Puccinia striiformis f. sp. tritici TaxID=168172 RepID=UPI002007C315|nr:hypothetical protein Pst134EA_028988 [Puccinia striiformis f. sp. tritici]KAH9447004.1 hypothetical protein Pst134EA_028988 [Puccinia striiformis f. sp. tritici]